MTVEVSVFLPIAAFVAVILFVIRELLDARKLKKQRLRKLRAVKALLAFETERNYGAQKRLFRVVEDIREHLNEGDDYEFAAVQSFGGIIQYRRSDQTAPNTMSGMLILPFHTVEFERCLPIIAELEEKLYTSAMEVYEQIFELRHLYASLIRYLLKEELGAHFFLEGFTEYALHYKREMEESFQRFYTECTGKSEVPERIR